MPGTKQCVSSNVDYIDPETPRDTLDFRLNSVYDQHGDYNKNLRESVLQKESLRLLTECQMKTLKDAKAERLPPYTCLKGHGRIHLNRIRGIESGTDGKGRPAIRYWENPTKHSIHKADNSICEFEEDNNPPFSLFPSWQISKALKDLPYLGVSVHKHCKTNMLREPLLNTGYNIVHCDVLVNILKKPMLAIHKRSLVIGKDHPAVRAVVLRCQRKLVPLQLQGSVDCRVKFSNREDGEESLVSLRRYPVQILHELCYCDLPGLGNKLWQEEDAFEQ
ncbi:hypothetical protein X801_03873, partial [Opisthorchis viverrini]